MADEYVRKEDVLKEKRTGTFPNGICMEAKACVTVEYIKSIPPADVAPVVHGHWVNGRCDKCGEHAPFWPMASTYYESDFCPNCGAKMDGGKHG